METLIEIQKLIFDSPKEVEHSFKKGSTEIHELPPSAKNDPVLMAVLNHLEGLEIEKFIRILGIGGGVFSRGFFEWNRDLRDAPLGIDDMLIIADDVVGGLFGLKHDEVYYYAPDRLMWENLGISYTSFFHWVLFGDTETFYKSFRWSCWKKDVDNVSFSQGILLYPFLWSSEFNLETSSKKVVPLIEIVLQNLDIASQLS